LTNEKKQQAFRENGYVMCYQVSSTKNELSVTVMLLRDRKKN
jgi:uncharacterized protein YkuJ